MVNGLPVTRTSATERGLDPLAGARRVLQQFPPLTFEQLSWPTDAQLSGDDGGAYRASAQLFVSDSLLGLKNGPAQLRAMLETLPRFYNWQTAFQSAFRDDFPRPLDVEKWWALQVVGFAAHDPGPQWTPAVSRDKLDEILSVPVEIARDFKQPARRTRKFRCRPSSAIWILAQQTAILQTKLRDLGLAQLRMAPQFAALADGYRRALADYLGERNASVTGVRPAQNTFAVAPKKPGQRETREKTGCARRATADHRIKPGPATPTSRVRAREILNLTAASPNGQLDRTQFTLIVRY